jgi:hypothetical protein
MPCGGLADAAGEQAVHGGVSGIDGKDANVLIGRGERRAEEERPVRLRLLRDPVQGEHCDQVNVAFEEARQSMEVARRWLLSR